jgi:hypothetical protein
MPGTMYIVFDQEQIPSWEGPGVGWKLATKLVSELVRMAPKYRVDPAR